MQPWAGDGDPTHGQATDDPLPVNTGGPVAEDESNLGAGSSTDPFAGFSVHGRPFDNPAPRHLKKELLRAKTLNTSLALLTAWVRTCDAAGEKHATRVLQQGVRHKLMSTRVQWNWQELEAVCHQILVKHSRLTGSCVIYVSACSTPSAPTLRRPARRASRATTRHVSRRLNTKI